MSNLVWAAETSYSILDSPVLVQADGADAASGMARLLAPFSATDEEISQSHMFSLVDGVHLEEPEPEVLFAYRNCKRVSGSITWNGAAIDLMTRINQMVIGDYLGYALHAGVVAYGDSALALPASSGGGKTTLTAACLRAGFAYVSDEALCIDPATAQVVPYPKPLGMSPWSRRALGIDDADLPLVPEPTEEALVPPDVFGTVSSVHPAGPTPGFAGPPPNGRSAPWGEKQEVVATKPLTLRHVVLSEYGVGPARLEPAGGGDAMHALLEFSFNHYKFGEQAFHLAARVASGAEAWRLTYDEPLEAAELLREKLT